MGRRHGYWGVSGQTDLMGFLLRAGLVVPRHLEGGQMSGVEGWLHWLSRDAPESGSGWEEGSESGWGEHLVLWGFQ